MTLGDFKPDITFLLDLPVADGLARSLRQKDVSSGKENTEDRFEKLQSEFHEKLRQGFLTIAKADTNRCVVVDALQSADDVYSVIWGRVKNAL